MKVILSAFVIVYLGTVFWGTELAVADEADSKAVSLLTAEAQEGNPIAQYHLGNIYSSGMAGVEIDLKRGLDYFRESAAQGYAPAQYNLAASYKLGDGIPKNTEKALEWYLAAADQGHTDAQLQAAIILQARGGFADALTLFRSSALLGNTNAQALLGASYHSGEGAPQNFEQAYIWYSLAAANGDEEAAALREVVAKQLDKQALSRVQKESLALYDQINSSTQ